MKNISESRNLISVLYVDDEPLLLSICKTYLEKRPDLFITTANSVMSAIALLETFRFDVILSGYQMPGINGIGFLKMLQQKGCTLPFILFTGKGREEIVIEAINNGATYYIQKGGDPHAQFAELEHKIREASRRHKAESDLRDIELQYRTLFEHAGTVFITLEDDLTISRANSGFCLLTGYSREEIEGRLRWTDFIAFDDIKRMVLQYNNLRAGLIPAITGFEIHLVTKDQQLRKMYTTAAIIPTTERTILSMVDRFPHALPGDTVKKEHDEDCTPRSTAES